jgi:orotate phosphoribosyltransferase
MTQDDFLSLAAGRRGHFLYESGYHSDLWFDLETLCQNPAALRPFIPDLGRHLEPFHPDVICGPLIEGAFVALLAASELRCDFVYTLRFNAGFEDKLFGVPYELPKSLQSAVTGKRIAIVNDVISAGSAVRGTLQSLRQAGAEIVCIASLVVLGDSFPPFAREHEIPLRTLLTLPNNTWEPEHCPLCAQGIPLQNLADH